MKKIKKILFMVTVFALCITAIPIQVQAAGSKNQKAHKAYQSKLKKIKKAYSYSQWGRYLYVDLNGDKTDELVVEIDMYTFIYTYKKGKVKKVFEDSSDSGVTIKYYRKSKVIRTRTYAMDDECVYYYKLENNKYKMKAYNYGPHVKGKKVKTKVYKSYIKKLTKGEKGKSLDNRKWKKL